MYATFIMLNSIINIELTKDTDNILTTKLGPFTLSTDMEGLPAFINNILSIASKFGMDTDSITNLEDLPQTLETLKNDIIKCEYMVIKQEFNISTGKLSITECVLRGYSLDVYKYIGFLKDLMEA